MEEQKTIKRMRRQLAPMSRALLVYYLLMNFLVVLVAGLDASIRLVTIPGMSVQQAIYESLKTNYWGYLLTIGIGVLILLRWKGLGFFRKEICRPGRAMTAASFLFLFTWLFHVQLFSAVMNQVMDWILSFWGLSTAGAMEAATAQIESTSMFLYVCIAAPISEELLFRGLILRGFMPFGKKFAIFASAALFGLYHGNLVQIPFAFLVGLILGFTAAEYNVGWAIVLHVCNNMILGDTLGRLLNLLSPVASLLLQQALMVILTVALVVLTWQKRRGIKTWLGQERLNGRAFGALFSCPSAIILILIVLFSMCMSVL